VRHSTQAFESARKNHGAVPLLPNDAKASCSVGRNSGKVYAEAFLDGKAFLLKRLKILSGFESFFAQKWRRFFQKSREKRGSFLEIPAGN